MKFHAATSDTSRPQPTLWVAIALIVLLAGEAALQATWWWLALVSLLTLGTAGAILWRSAAHARGLAVGLILLALASGIATGRTAHAVIHRNALSAEAVASATADRDRVLQTAVAAANRIADLALLRVGRATPGTAPDLDDLLSGVPIESAIAVTAGDTIVALAGPHRIQPTSDAAPAALVVTPFAHLLIVRTQGVVDRASHARRAQVTLLLDASPAVPVANASLASSAGAWERVQWRWKNTVDAPPTEYPTLNSMFAGVRAAMLPVAPPASALVLREQAVARFLVAGGLVALALVILLSVTQPVARIGAILLPLWALVRSDVGGTHFGLSAIRALLAAAALMLLAIMLWRRPARRSITGLVAAVLLLVTAPPVVAMVAESLVSHGSALTLAGAFGWSAILALASGAYLAVAAAPLRSPGDMAGGGVGGGAAWGIAATASALLVGLIGVMAWSPAVVAVGSEALVLARWAWWYPILWLVPIALQLPLTTPRSRLVAIATTAGVLASLAIWSTSLGRRMELANADLDRLNSVRDTTAAAALEQFADVARDAHATRLDRLYAAWAGSSLARLGVPTYLALWNAAGHQRAAVALDSLSIGWDSLAPLVAEYPSGPPRRIGLRLGAGHHQVLILPLAPDTIATITVGPRSRLLAPTTFGLLVGWRSPSTSPPYTVDVAVGQQTARDTLFRRRNRFLTRDQLITAADIPRVVRATVEIAPPGRFVVRGALVVLIDAGLILAAWMLLQRILGQTVRPPGVFRRSYRRAIATALMAFFIVPAGFFTLLSVFRLRQDAQHQHAVELSATLSDIAIEGGLAMAAAPRPSSDSLALIAEDVNAELGVYRRGRLIAASDPILAELGLLPTVLVDRQPLPSGADITTVAPHPRSALAGPGFQLGVLETGTESRSDQTGDVSVLVAAVPGSDSAPAPVQIDQAMQLLLVVLSGVVASILVAGWMARTLGRPIESLRLAAVAIGRNEVPPEVPATVPSEFAPVFAAITQMEHDLRISEAELRAGRTRTAAILSTVATAVVGVDRTGAVTHANARAAELMGTALEIDKSLVDQLRAEWQVMADAVERGLTDATRLPETRELDLDGRRIATTLAPLADGGLVLAATDITESARAARVLAWGEMARQVAHEIKNPLTPMRLGLQHLRRLRTDRSADLPQAVDETVRRLLVEIERLDRIARSFARYGAVSDAGTALTPISMRGAVDEVVSLFALGGELPIISIRDREPGAVQAHAGELAQVLLNLLENARNAGASRVEILVADHSLTVHDDGRGIPASQVERIFEPTFSTTTSGTGLGLAIVRRLVEGWGATIEVRSEPGTGAEFTITFVPAPMDE